MNRPINRITVYKRADGKFDFRITAGENGDTLCSSDQGYESRSEAVDMGRRVAFGDYDPTITFTGETP